MKDFFSPENENVIFQKTKRGEYLPFQLDLSESFKGNWQFVEDDLNEALRGTRFFCSWRALWVS